MTDLLEPTKMDNISSNASEWLHLTLTPKSDLVLYLSPRNSSETGFSISRGTDLLAHRAPSGTPYFYLYYWSLYSNETNICQIISVDSARDFILERMRGRDLHEIKDPERIRILEYFPGIFDL
jgi:hypothetical protein